uniref:Uncharacterized protein n=1 Tax=Octopus bimaculoides TaxID=37653 RepID=A0A0L8HJV7_OCTBM
MCKSDMWTTSKLTLFILIGAALFFSASTMRVGTFINYGPKTKEFINGRELENARDKKKG